MAYSSPPIRAITASAPEARREGALEGREDPVAGLHAEAIVHLLEAIEVGHRHGQGAGGGGDDRRVSIARAIGGRVHASEELGHIGDGQRGF